MAGHTTFRAGVGLLVVNERGEVLAIERRTPRGSWQLPQGGIEVDERPIDAAYRELREETGLVFDDVVCTFEHPVWLGYELPPEYRSAKTGRGQALRWFVFRLRARSATIRLPPHGEAAASNWTLLRELTAIVADFRRPLYEQLEHDMAPYLVSVLV